jgi:two-component system, LytTR family, response regulator
MMKAIIIDDEKDGVESLEMLLRENCPGVDIIGTATDPQQAAGLILQKRPQVVFLDIHMPGMSGFELLDKMKQVHFHVIFTTAYDHYAVQAFRANAVDYLLKPVIIGELVSAVNKVKNMVMSPQVGNSDIEALLEKIRTRQPVSRLAVSSMNEILYIDYAQISYLEADSNYTNIILRNGKRINSTKTLKEYEGMLDPASFFRVFKTHIINLAHVEKFIKGDGGYIVMNDGTRVPVSREKRQQLLEILGNR